jgi:hypothetical protein
MSKLDCVYVVQSYPKRFPRGVISFLEKIFDSLAKTNSYRKYIFYKISHVTFTSPVIMSGPFVVFHYFLYMQSSTSHLHAYLHRLLWCDLFSKTALMKMWSYWGSPRSVATQFFFLKVWQFKKHFSSNKVRKWDFRLTIMWQKYHISCNQAFHNVPMYLPTCKVEIHTRRFGTCKDLRTTDNNLKRTFLHVLHSLPAFQIN